MNSTIANSSSTIDIPAVTPRSDSSLPHAPKEGRRQHLLPNGKRCRKFACGSHLGLGLQHLTASAAGPRTDPVGASQRCVFRFRRFSQFAVQLSTLNFQLNLPLCRRPHIAPFPHPEYPLPSRGGLGCESVWPREWCIAGFIFTTIFCASANAQQFDQKFFSEMRWRCIGPFRGGRTVAISGVPHQPNLFYMAAVNGGVWKTTDFGNTWIPIFDDQPTGSVGALAVAPSDPSIVYVGSGEGLQRPDLATGDGVYKSIDAGKSWTHLQNLRDAQQIAAILIDPKDPNRVFVAAEGHPYGPNAERGVFRSTDGGQSFQKVLYKDENTGAADLAFDPTNPQTIYAALWAARVAPWEVRSGASIYIAGSGLYKSTDGGDTWKPLTKGLPGASEGLGRIGIAIAPSDAKRIYVSAEATKVGGVYRSDDAGESWKQVNADHRIGGRGPGAMGIAVAPDNPDVIYVANTTTWKSTDGGKTFVGFKGAPGGDDYQRLWISTENPQIIALSSDQGAVISVNGGATWSSWYNQPTAQFYHVTTDNRFPYWVYGAQQESGSVATQSRSDYGEITFRDWKLPGIFEYGYIAADPLDPNILYGDWLTRTKQDIGEYAKVTPEPIRRGEYRYARTLPVVFSPLEPHTLYFAANVLFKTTDAGNSWQVISPDLTRESYETPANLGVFAASDPEKGKHRGVIYAVAPSFKEANTIWAGTDDGLIHITRDGGKSWHLPHARFRQIVDGNHKKYSRWRRQQRGARRSASQRFALRRHGRLRLRFLQRWRRLAAAATQSAAHVHARSRDSWR